MNRAGGPRAPVDRAAPSAAKVLLRVGALDGLSTRAARELLQGLSQRRGLELVVDLSRLDDGHQITMFVLLSGSARVIQRRGGSVTAVQPAPRLASSLSAAAIPVEPAAQEGGQAEEVHVVGRLRL